MPTFYQERQSFVSETHLARIMPSSFRDWLRLPCMASLCILSPTGCPWEPLEAWVPGRVPCVRASQKWHRGPLSGQTVLCGDVKSLPCRMSGSILGLCPPDTSSVPTPRIVTTNVSRYRQCPGGRGEGAARTPL